MTRFRLAGALAVALTAPWLWVATAHAEAFAQLGQVPVVASPTCAGSVSAEAQVTPVQVDDRVEDGSVIDDRQDARRGVEGVEGSSGGGVDVHVWRRG